MEMISGIILSGGKSLRMGSNKAFIKIDGIPIIERIYTLFNKFFNEIIIVTDIKDYFSNWDVKIYDDLIPHKGALGGIYTGLFFSSFHFSFCVACDMPFLQESVIHYLIEQKNGYDIIVPKTQDGFQPLHAIYSKNCLKPIRSLMGAEKSKIIDLFPMVHTKIIEEKEFLNLDPKKTSFVNVNTPEELLMIQTK
jgi:molybdopterin-guanine dinucleotide biosynthesis protein A